MVLPSGRVNPLCAYILYCILYFTFCNLLIRAYVGFHESLNLSFIHCRFILQPVDTIKTNIGDKMKTSDEKIKTIQVQHTTFLCNVFIMNIVLYFENKNLIEHCISF